MSLNPTPAVQSCSLSSSQQREVDEQKKKWAEEKAARSYDGMFTQEAIDAARDEWSDDDFM
jgi:hypothetical protein